MAENKISYAVYLANFLGGVAGFPTNMIAGGLSTASRMLEDTGLSFGRRYLLDIGRAAGATTCLILAAHGAGEIYQNPANMPEIIQSSGELLMAWRLFADTIYTKKDSSWKKLGRDLGLLKKLRGGKNLKKKR